jgi:hypothetical protein
MQRSQIRLGKEVGRARVSSAARASVIGASREIVLDGEIALLDYRGVPHIDDLGTTSPGTGRQ